MARVASLWIVAITLPGILHMGLAELPAYVSPTVVQVSLGNPTNFTCKSFGAPLSTCLWERDVAGHSANTTLILNFNKGNPKPVDGPTNGYSYLGDGMEKGECGLVIQNVRYRDEGIWKCTLITNTGTLYRGLVDLTVLRKPEPLYFNMKVLNNLVDRDGSRGSRIRPRIGCYSANGKPPPRFRWFIDNETLIDGLSPISVTHLRGSSYFFQELTNPRFTWKDNGKKLRCVIQHDTLTENDKKETTLDINISFAPRSSQPDSRLSASAEIGKEKLLNVTVLANPKPDKVFWTVDNKFIQEGNSTDKYEALKLQNIANGVYQANLKIKSVAKDDINKHFFLFVANLFGEANFDVKVAN